jgi:hypothetical protein
VVDLCTVTFLTMGWLALCRFGDANGRDALLGAGPGGRWRAVVLAFVLGACGEPGETPTSRDAHAQLACASFEKLLAAFTSLSSAERSDLAFEMWENAQFSRTPGIKRVGRQVLKAVIQERESIRDLTFREMRQACAGRAG